MSKTPGRNIFFLRYLAWLSKPKGLVFLTLLVFSLTFAQPYIFPQLSSWTGFGKYWSPSGERTVKQQDGTVIIEELQPGKQLWDWMNALIFPFSLLILGAWLQGLQQNQEKIKQAEEKRSAEENAREEVLQSYIDRMSELLLGPLLDKSKNKNSLIKNKALNVARTRTLSVLRRLNTDGERKRSVIQFLIDAELLTVETGDETENKLDLSLADLSYAKLEDLNLRGAKIGGANLQGADLTNVNLEKAHLVFSLSDSSSGNTVRKPVNLREAKLNKANLTGVDLSTANVEFAELREAVLISSKLNKTSLKGSDMTDAQLGGANLLGADLSKTTLVRASFIRADLRQVTLKEAIFKDTDITGSILKGQEQDITESGRVKQETKLTLEQEDGIIRKTVELAEETVCKEGISSTKDVIFQYFHWYLPADGNLWSEVKENSKDIANVGFTAVLLPPPYKGIGGGYDVGYGVYDLFDLGEFDQKGSIRTKYGTREQYLDAIASLQNCGVQVYGDVVLNHKMAADAEEEFRATPVNSKDRTQMLGGIQVIKSWTQFDFPGRNQQYSNMKWHWWHFNAVDYNTLDPNSGAIYLIEGKKFAEGVSKEYGNYDYLMGCNVDFQNQEVQDEVARWGRWYIETTKINGFRLDAAKHIPSWFFPKWIDELKRDTNQALFVVSEYFSNDVSTLLRYLDEVEGKMFVFDVPLHYNFHYASCSNGNYDMRKLLDGTVMKSQPSHAVTYVEDHNSQPLQEALGSAVEPWFKPLAYALILLRREGYPCVFYADYYGAQYEGYGRDRSSYLVNMPSHRSILDKFLYVRKYFDLDVQYDYFDHPDIIGWTRASTQDNTRAIAVIMSDSLAGSKLMNTEMPQVEFIDITEQIKEPVQTDGNGWGEFKCMGGSVSVWIPKWALPT
jgi:alpha-amylase